VQVITKRCKTIKDKPLDLKSCQQRNLDYAVVIVGSQVIKFVVDYPPLPDAISYPAAQHLQPSASGSVGSC